MIFPTQTKVFSIHLYTHIPLIHSLASLRRIVLTFAFEKILGHLSSKTLSANHLSF